MGLFNEIFDVVAPVLVETFVDNERDFRRRETVYDQSTGVSTPTDINASFLTGPPAPFGKGEVGSSFGGTQNMVKIGDTVMVVTTAHYTAKGFDIEPSSNAQVFVTVEGQEYLVLGVNPYNAGDGNVAVRLHLRR